MPGPVSAHGATLSRRARLVTWGVGFGVGLGVPLVLGVAFAAAFGTLVPLALPLAFGIAIGLLWRCRITGYRVTPEAIMVLRPCGARRIALAEIAEVRHPAGWPPGPVYGLWRAEGFFGSQGVYWNRDWGRFRVHVTDAAKRVEIRLRDGGRVLVSPDDPERFVRAVRAALKR